MISFCCLAPGSFFVVESPPKIYKWMAEHTQPLLFVINPIKVVLLKNIATLPSVRVIESSDRLQAFHIPNCKIGIIDVHLIKLPCIGKTCDCLGMVDGTKCACVGTQDCAAGMCLCLGLRVKTPKPHKDFKILNHTSKKYTKEFMKNGHIPLDMDVNEILSDRHTWLTLRECVETVINFWNDETGVSVTGWVRKGKVKDQGLDEGQTPRGKTEEKVESGQMTYHITSIVPSGSVTADKKTEVNGLRFDILNIGQLPVDV